MPSRTPIRAGFLVLVLTLLVLFGASPARAANDDEVRATLAQLPDADFDGKTELIEKLVTLDHPRIATILKALSDSRLYYQEDPGRVVRLPDNKVIAFGVRGPQPREVRDHAACTRIGPRLLRRIKHEP